MRASEEMRTTAQTFVEHGVDHYRLMPDRDWRDSSPCMMSADSALPVGRLRRRLLREKVNLDPEAVTTTGTFFPAALLSSGWWERQKKRERPNDREFATTPSLRSWLQRGFEEWGPSWDFNVYETGARAAAPLFGQIADGDEVNSIPIIVCAEKARDLRRNHLPELKPVPVRVRGLLCHRDSKYFRNHNTAFSAATRYFGKAFQYVILVEDGRPGHGVSRLSGVSDPYTGYLWQCWAPVSALAGGTPPCLKDVFFLWEHTDLSNIDALHYNLDSLQHKADYVQRVVGRDMAMLFKSSAIVPGTPCLSNEQFFNTIAAGFTDR